MSTAFNSIKDFLIEVRAGNVSGHSIRHVFGSNDAVGTTFEKIDFNQAATIEPLPTASALEIVSSDVDDASAGKGIRQLTIEGVDSSFNEITETISMNGQTAVTTTATFQFVNNAFSVEIGISNAAEGGIAIKHTGGANVADIRLGLNSMEQSSQMIPAGKTGCILNYGCHIAAGKELILQICEVSYSGNNAMHVQKHIARHSDKGFYKFEAPLKINAQTIVEFRGQSSAQTNDVRVWYDLLLVDD